MMSMFENSCPLFYSVFPDKYRNSTLKEVGLLYLLLIYSHLFIILSNT